MKYNAEQVTFMLAEAIDQNREYKSWHCSTQHLMTLVERVVAEEREALEAELLKLKKGIASNSDYIQGRWDLIGEFQDIIRARGQANG